jgi:hypothetical protein
MHNLFPYAGITRIRYMGMISARYIKAPLRFRGKDNKPFLEITGWLL